MDIKGVAKAGTLESNDIMVIVGPNDEGKVEIDIDSIVYKQFGDDIRKTIEDKLNDMNITSVNLRCNDKGALDYTIRARVEVAIKRALGKEEI